MTTEELMEELKVRGMWGRFTQGGIAFYDLKGDLPPTGYTYATGVLYTFLKDGKIILEYTVVQSTFAKEFDDIDSMLFFYKHVWPRLNER